MIIFACVGLQCFDIQPVKIEWWGVDVVTCLERGAHCLHVVQLVPLPSPSSLTSFKSRLVLPFWYRLTQVVLERRPLNRCNSSSSSSSSICCACVFISVATLAAPCYRPARGCRSVETCCWSTQCCFTIGWTTDSHSHTLHLHSFCSWSHYNRWCTVNVGGCKPFK